MVYIFLALLKYSCKSLFTIICFYKNPYAHLLSIFCYSFELSVCTIAIIHWYSFLLSSIVKLSSSALDSATLLSFILIFTFLAIYFLFAVCYFYSFLSYVHVTLNCARDCILYVLVNLFFCW